LSVYFFKRCLSSPLSVRYHRTVVVIYAMHLTNKVVRQSTNQTVLTITTCYKPKVLLKVQPVFLIEYENTGNPQILEWLKFKIKLFDKSDAPLNLFFIKVQVFTMQNVLL